MSTAETTYHPDPEINAGVIAEAIEGERLDLAAGYQPRRWRCICGTEHSRGHVAGTIGVHRCLACGYAGTGGVMLDDGETPPADGPCCTGCGDECGCGGSPHGEAAR